MSSIGSLVIIEGDDRVCGYCGNPFFLHRQCNYHTNFLSTPVKCPFFMEKMKPPTPIELGQEPPMFDPKIFDPNIFDTKSDAEKINELNEEIDSQIEEISKLTITIKKFEKSEEKLKDDINELKGDINELKYALYTVILAKNGLQKICDYLISKKNN